MEKVEVLSSKKEANQKKVRAFAFPTAKSIKKQKDKHDKLQEHVGKRILHKKYGYGVVHGVGIDPKGTPYVVGKDFSECNGTFEKGDTRYILDLKDIEFVELKSKKSKTIPFDVNDIVTHEVYGQGIIFSISEDKRAVLFRLDDKSVPPHAEKQEGPEHVKLLPVSELKSAVTKAPKSKLRFEDIGLFFPFEYKELTYVKISKSNAIKSEVRGGPDEPFVMLATPTSKISGASIVRFKKSDKVQQYSGN